MGIHLATVQHGHVQYSVFCAGCDFLAFTKSRTEAEHWAAEHIAHPDRDIAGLWGWSRWRAVRGINHAWPFGTAPCGTLRYETALDPQGREITVALDADAPGDASLPMCPACLAIGPADREMPPID